MTLVKIFGIKKRDLGRKLVACGKLPGLFFPSETLKAWFHIHVEQGNKSWTERKRPAVTTDSCLLQKPNPMYPHLLFSRNNRLSCSRTSGGHVVQPASAAEEGQL